MKKKSMGENEKGKRDKNEVNMKARDGGRGGGTGFTDLCR